ncbi:hypothetical protein CRT23_21455 [Methylobacterium sp. V23]|nr:hypothetical protein CRT23_21455 [Methylobacterium sp. V23]
MALEAGHIMQIQAGERLRLTLWGAGCRAMVSLNTYGVTQPALVGMDPAEDGFTYDVTSWLHDGCNTLTVVLIGDPGETSFRMTVAQDGRPDWTLDEADFLPLGTPWRLWTMSIECEAPRASVPACEQAPETFQIIVGGRPPGPLGLGRSLRTDQSMAPPSFISMATPDQPVRAASA